MGTWVHVYKHVCRGPKFALDIFLKKALPPKLLRHGLSLKLKLIPAGLASLLQGSLAPWLYILNAEIRDGCYPCPAFVWILGSKHQSSYLNHGAISLAPNMNNLLAF